MYVHWRAHAARASPAGLDTVVEGAGLAAIVHVEHAGLPWPLRHQAAVRPAQQIAASVEQASPGTIQAGEVQVAAAGTQAGLPPLPNG